MRYVVYQDRNMGGVRLLKRYSDKPNSMEEAVHLVHTLSSEPFRDGWFIIEEKDPPSVLTGPGW